MKLAEALILRTDLQKRLVILKQRIIDNVKVQEGDKPAEDPNQLLQDMNACQSEIVELIQRINRTNSLTQLDSANGIGSLADALAIRSSLSSQHAMYREIAQSGLIKHNHFSRSEIKFISMINVAEIQTVADKLAKEHRELDAKIQSANWNVDLL